MCKIKRRARNEIVDSFKCDSIYGYAQGVQRKAERAPSQYINNIFICVH
jgi:hypothetical protein